MGNERLGVDVARPELEPIAEIGNKERAGDSGAFAQALEDRQLGGQDSQERERPGERAEASREEASKQA